jgi:hypothetical protein
MWDKSRFAFLDNECARSRYAMAAYHLRTCEHILEIGGSISTIDQFVIGSPQSVTVTDPLLNDKSWQVGRTEFKHVGALYQDCDYSSILNGSGKKGLLLLGAMLAGSMVHRGPVDDLVKMTEILRNMNMVVLEGREKGGSAASDPFLMVAELCIGLNFVKILEFDFVMKHDKKHPHGRIPEQDDRFGGTRTYRIYEK